MATFMLSHSHRPEECRVAFAAWRGFESPLRHDHALGSCATRGGASDLHRIWWTVEAPDPASALAQLPEYVAARTDVSPVNDLATP
jgi:hypothetical protein